MKRRIPLLLCSLLTAASMGCESTPEPTGNAGPASTGSVTSTMQRSDDVQYYPSDDPLRLGREYFYRGAYGTAERYFRDAVEKAPEDRSAWIGLAASYDRIGRFDFADKAYRAAIKLGGETPHLLNNMGYSYMLRGDLPQARAKFNQALQGNPQNETIRNNLQLLNTSARSIERDPQVTN